MAPLRERGRERERECVRQKSLLSSRAITASELIYLSKCSVVSSFKSHQMCYVTTTCSYFNATKISAHVRKLHESLKVTLLHSIAKCPVVIPQSMSE